MKKDGHIHTEFCPHGSNDNMREYVENAIKYNYDEITFTEHLCYPEGFKDPSPENDSVLPEYKVEEYLCKVESLKKEYSDKIKINVGFEVDYIDGYEDKTRELLDKYGSRIDDAILSIHIIKVGEIYECIDYCKEDIEKLISIYGGIDKLYQKYYETVKKAVLSDLGEYKPKRIGHFNLIRRFCKLFPYDYSGRRIIEEIMSLISEKGDELDYNIAGLRKKECGEVYVSGYAKEMAEKYSVPMVLGSDSHSADTICDYSDYIK